MSARDGRISALRAGVIALVIAQAALAADFTWDGDTDSSLATATNWVGNAAPLNDNTSNLIFPGGLGAGASVTPTVAAGTQYFKMATFDVGAPAYTLLGNGNELEFSNVGGTGLVNNSSSTQVVSASGTSSFFFTGYFDTTGGDIVVNGPLRLASGSNAGTRWVSLAGSHNIYFNVDSSIHPAGDVNGGTWTASATNSMYARARSRFFMTNFSGTAFLGNIGTSYTGSIILDTTSNGALRLTHDSALGSPAGSNTGGAIYINGGSTCNGTLEFANNVSVTRWVMYLDGRSGAVADDPHLRNVSGNNTFTVVGDWNTGSRMPITRTTDNGVTTYSAGNWNFQSDAGKLTLVNGPIYNTGPVAINLQLTGAGDGQIDAPLTFYQANPSFNIVKKGTGTWTFTNPSNDYPGTTTIEQGTVSLGTTGAIAQSSAIIVGSGATFDVAGLSGGYILGPAQALEGRGTVNNSVTAGSGSTIAPGDSVPGTLTITGDVNLTGGGTLQFDLSSSPAGANSKLLVTGALLAAGSTTVTITPVNGFLSSGTYRLIDYVGPALDPGSLTPNGLINTARQSFSLDTASANHVDLVVTGDPAELTWKGGLAGNAWDVDATSNWAIGIDPSHFFNNDLVTFDDTGAFPDVDIVAPVFPGRVTFANSSGHDYALSGASVNVAGDFTTSGTGNVTLANSDLTVVGSLAHNSSGTLTLANTGPVSAGAVTTSGSGNLMLANADITAAGGFTQGSTGTLTIANTGVLSGNFTINSGTVAVNRADDYTLTNSFTGVGTLRKDGLNVLTMADDCSGLTGLIDIASGVARVNPGSTAALTPAASLGTTVENGATLDVNGVKLLATTVTIAGPGASGQLGALVDAGDTGTASAARAELAGVILADDATIGSTALSYPLVVQTGSILQGNGHSLTMRGLGEWDFYECGETHLANIIIHDAGTYFGTTTTLGDQPGVVTVRDGGLLGLERSPVVTKNIVVDATNGGIACFNSDNAVASLVTINGSCEALVYSLNNSATEFSNRTLTFSGKLTGPGNLVVHCTVRNASAAVKAHELGTVAFTSDVNDYAGTTTIGGGGGFSQVAAADDHITLMVGNGGTTGKLAPGPVINNGTLQFNRSDTVTLANDVSGGGDISVAAGTLLIDTAVADTGTYRPEIGGTLGGIGTLGGPISVIGTLAPGNASPGTLTAAGLILNDGATISLRLKTPDATDDDAIVATGALDISALTTLHVKVTALSGPTLADGNYLIAQYGSIVPPAAPPTVDYVGPLAPGQHAVLLFDGIGQRMYLRLGKDVGPTLSPDIDNNGTVDITDLGLILACYSGPNIPFSLDPVDCTNRDLDVDSDVDQVDFAVWQSCFNASFQAEIPRCTVHVVGQ